MGTHGKRALLSGKYEAIRLGRYATYPYNAEYTKQELEMYYDLWITTLGKRDNEWHTYCDVRDNKPFGTNARIEEARLNKEISLH